MILLDAYAVVAFLRDEKAAATAVERIIDDGAAISTANLAEVVDHLVRVHGADDEEATLDVMQLGLNTVDLDESIALTAGILRSRHYHRRRRQVGVADCIAAATAQRHPTSYERLATADPHLLDLLHDEGIGLLALPSVDGSEWSPPSER